RVSAARTAANVRRSGGAAVLYFHVPLDRVAADQVNARARRGNATGKLIHLQVPVDRGADEAEAARLLQLQVAGDVDVVGQIAPGFARHGQVTLHESGQNLVRAGHVPGRPEREGEQLLVAAPLDAGAGVTRTPVQGPVCDP